MLSRSVIGAILFYGLHVGLGSPLAPRLSAQVIESWEVYSALDRSTSIASASDGSVWVGTTGGVYRYHPASGTSQVYRTDDALLDLTATAVGVSPDKGDVYVGGDDGTVSILRQEGWWTYVTDIARSSRPDPAIRGFRFGDGKAYILTTFGVAVYNPSDSTIRDSWTRFGSIAPNTGVNDLMFYRDSVWVATDSGLAVAPASGRDLADPLNWKIYEGSSCGKQTLSLAVIAGVLNVGTNDGACRLDDGAFARRDDLGGPIRFAINGDRIVAASDFRLYRLDDSQRFQEMAETPRKIVAVASLADGAPVAALERDGIGISDAGSLDVYAPDGPISNSFEDLTFGLDGSLWVGTGIGGSGVARLRDNGWINYTAERTPGLTTNSSWRINTDDLGRVWVSSFGDGVSIFTPGEGTDITVTHYDETNSPIRSGSATEPFVIVSDAGADGLGRVWFINWHNAIPGTVLLALARDGSGGSEEFEQYPTTLTGSREYNRLAIDFNGTKWLGCNGSAGLLFFNENGAEGGGNKWGLLTTSHGLPSSTQTALLVDPDGELWIGTPQGLVVLVNPGSVMQNGASSAIFRTIRSLENVFIRDIAVDALNRKWVGTNDGVVVLSSDGTDLLATYTEANSPLVNDEIRAILPNDATGEIYIGTIEGMNKVKTEAVRSDVVDQLTATPQPYELPASEPMRITGLPTNSTVKILSTSGTLVREFLAPGGGVAFWHGEDNEGEPVSSGVYIIAAKSSLGETVIGKAAVVRR